MQLVQVILFSDTYAHTHAHIYKRDTNAHCRPTLSMCIVLLSYGKTSKYSMAKEPGAGSLHSPDAWYLFASRHTTTQLRIQIVTPTVMLLACWHLEVFATEQRTACEVSDQNGHGLLYRGSQIQKPNMIAYMHG